MAWYFRPVDYSSTIEGVVYIDGIPQTGGKVSCRQSGRLVAESEVTINGNYTINNLDPGTYSLEVIGLSGKSIGFVDNIEVRLGRFELCDIYLK